MLNDETDQLGMLEYAWSHAIISDELYSAVRKECDSFKEEEEGGKPSKGCSPAVKAFLSAYDDIDIYSIYTPVCLSSFSSRGSRRSSNLVRSPQLLSRHVWKLNIFYSCMCLWFHFFVCFLFLKKLNRIMEFYLPY